MNHCYSSATGTELELRHAYETEHLQPPHRFVPWVLVNNKALEQVGPFSSLSLSTHSTFRMQDYGNYIAHVCQAYTGRNRPAACNTPPEINSTEIANSVPQVLLSKEECELDIIATRRRKGRVIKRFTTPHKAAANSNLK